MSYKNIYMSGNYIGRVDNGDSYVILSDPNFYVEDRTVDSPTTIFANARDTFFDELTVNDELIVLGELEIMSSI